MDIDQEDIDVVVKQALKVKAEDFQQVLNDIESISDKKKRLWREIYENAIADRQNAYTMFMILVNITKMNSSEHAVHGKTMATYIEKMSKANDQIIKLADMIATAEIANEAVTSEDLFEQINKGRKLRGKLMGS